MVWTLSEEIFGSVKNDTRRRNGEPFHSCLINLDALDQMLFERVSRDSCCSVVWNAAVRGQQYTDVMFTSSPIWTSRLRENNLLQSGSFQRLDYWQQPSGFLLCFPPLASLADPSEGCRGLEHLSRHWARGGVNHGKNLDPQKEARGQDENSSARKDSSQKEGGGFTEQKLYEAKSDSADVHVTETFIRNT